MAKVECSNAQLTANSTSKFERNLQLVLQTFVMKIKSFIEITHTVPILTNNTITFKRQWLHSIRAARSAAEDNVPIPQVTQRSILEFLTEVGANT